MAEAVECYSGSEYGQRPMALLWQGQRLEVTQVQDESFTPNGRRFRVIAAGGQVFELFYAAQEDEWTIQAR